MSIDCYKQVLAISYQTKCKKCAIVATRKLCAVIAECEIQNTIMSACNTLRNGWMRKYSAIYTLKVCTEYVTLQRTL